VICPFYGKLPEGPLITTVSAWEVGNGPRFDHGSHHYDDCKQEKSTHDSSVRGEQKSVAALKMI
jgi:hypothetical protein